MNTLTRKQREILQREEDILELSRPMLIEGGYHGLNMDRIAAELEYSKGTIYKHFSCKEEIIIALAIETLEKRTDFFSRAAAFRGGSRERITAIGAGCELFVRLFPDHFEVEQIINSRSIWEKTSENRRNLMHTAESKCMHMVSGIVRDGIAQGDLQLPEGTTPEELVFGLWSLTFGAHSILSTGESLANLGIKEPFAAIRMNINHILDGCGWRPLFAEFDYKSLMQRIEDEVFPEEFQLAYTQK